MPIAMPTAAPPGTNPPDRLRLPRYYLNPVPLDPDVTPWAPSEEIKRVATARLGQGPYRFLFELPSRITGTVHQLVEVKLLLEAGASYVQKLIREQTLPLMLDHLNTVRDFCDQYPHCPKKFNTLSQSVDLVQQSLSRLLAALNPTEVAAEIRELGASIDLFQQSANDFFVYAPRKYSIVSFDVKRYEPLSLNYLNLITMTGNPRAVVFDIDDCLVMSEEFQKQSWRVSLSKWLEGKTSQQYVDPNAGRKLISAVEYCLQHDCTDKLLSKLCLICVRRGILHGNLEEQQAQKSIEEALNQHRANFLVDCVRKGALKFAPGALQLLRHCCNEGKRLAFCTNSPRDTAGPLLEAIFSKHGDGLKFDEVFNPQNRIYGDTTPIRKPHPLMWLVAVQRLGIRPADALIFDNSLNNCIGASQLPAYSADLPITTNGDDLLRPGENFAGIVGLTNGSLSLDKWLAWANSSLSHPVRAVIAGLDNLILR